MAQEMILAKLSQLQGFGEKFIAKLSDVSSRVKTLEAVGAQANLIERILVNGDPLSVGENKTVNIPVPTRVNQLENDASYQENVIERIQVNGVTQGITGKTVNVHMPTAVSELTNDENYQTNVLEGVKVNGTALAVDAEKNVNVSVPTKVSQLTNDKTYQTKTEVENTVKTAVAGSKHTSFQKVSSVPAVADAKEDVMYLVMNSVTKHYDIYAKIADDAGNFKMELLDDTTVDLSGYVQKEAGKGLSHNDFTDALLAKLNGIAEKANLYIHPGHTAYAEGLYKVTVDALGHVTKAVGVTKADITGLGIPGQDTHDWASITGKPTSYPPSGHTHDDRYYTESELDTKLAGKSATGHKHLWADITNKPSTFAPSAHKHVKADITDFPTSLPASDVKAWAKADAKPNYTWGEITEKPSSFTPASHTHDDRYYTEAEIDQKLKGTSASGHTHAWGEITGKPSAFPPSAHKHVKADISDFPASMPASDVSAWAKAATKPSYTKAEVGLSNVDNTADANKSVKHATSADTANVLSGFKPRSGQDWGIQTGTFVHGEHEDAGGDFTFRRDCPAAGQVSMVIDGCFYQHEGRYRVLDESDKNQFATAGHTHDDRYYTESEMDAKLAKKADTHSHPYLPTAGGNMGGTAMIKWPDSGNWSNKNDNVTFPVKRGGLSWSGQSDGIQLFAEETGNDNLELVLQFADDNSNGLTIRNKSGAAVSRLDANGGFSGSVAWEKITGKPSTFTPATHSHAWGDVTGKPSTFAPSAHKHVKADITDFPTSLPASDVKAWAKAANKPSYSWGEITNKPSTFAPAGHKHVKADITDFPTLGTAAAKNVGDFAAASHSHSWDSVTGKPTTFAPSSHNHDDRYYTESEMDTKLSGKANSSHTHNYAGSSSAGGTAASVNGFTFGVQTSDPGANSSLTTNKFLFVYE